MEKERERERRIKKDVSEDDFGWKLELVIYTNEQLDHSDPSLALASAVRSSARGV